MCCFSLVSKTQAFSPKIATTTIVKNENRFLFLFQNFLLFAHLTHLTQKRVPLFSSVHLTPTNSRLGS